MERLTILKQRLMRAVITVALVMACATAWAQNFTYDDNDTYTTGQYAAGIFKCSMFSEETYSQKMIYLSTLTSQHSPISLVFTCCASSMVTRFGPKRSW